MRTRWVGRCAWAAFALASACSLHSLDYLEAGGGGGAGGSMASGGDTASASGGGSSPASGGASSSSGGALSAGGSSGATSSSGGVVSAGGAASGSGGAAAELPDCGDKKQTADETDIDCGGRTCSPCPDNKKCAAGTDCQSAICTNQICQPPTCTDLAVNGDETDVNCGGSCAPCIDGLHCAQSADCKSKSCSAGVCVTPTCQDGVLQDGCPFLVDNTPYTLSPSSAPSRCIDDNSSVIEGNAALISSCAESLQETFWTVARPDGYFALRNALNAKCLTVRAASKDEGAVVEQNVCNYAAEQLWKPSRFDASLMQLTNKGSGLFLDVAGSNVDADGQGVVQAKADSADTRWRVQKSNKGGYAAFSPYDDATLRSNHADATVTLGTGDTASAHWKVVPGLSDPHNISFQCRDEPGRYLRHSNFRLWNDVNDGSMGFKRDATFHFVNPFVGASPLSFGFESVNYPAYFLLRNSSTVSLTQNAGTTDYFHNATWVLSPR
ncbi:MAG: AbfB domain-containing protein [Polyangiaceae bacterium]